MSGTRKCASATSGGQRPQCYRLCLFVQRPLPIEVYQPDTFALTEQSVSAKGREGIAKLFSLIANLRGNRIQGAIWMA
jgi:hypothetical protein